MKNPRFVFSAEIKQVGSRKAASGDIVYKVVFETDDHSLLALGIVPSDQLVDVEVKTQETSP